MRTLKTIFVAAFMVASGAAFSHDDMVEGEVEGIDPSAGKITLKHGAIKNLDMDAMTMSLRVKTPAMLENLKVGDKVRFEAERTPEGVTITMMQKSK